MTEDRWVYGAGRVLEALNPLSIHVTFTAIVAETMGNQKYVKNGHFRTLGLNYWETAEDGGVCCQAF